MGVDIRDQLRRDHETALAELQALRNETEEARCHASLRRMRRAWVIHALAEETVVYRALATLMPRIHALQLKTVTPDER